MAAIDVSRSAATSGARRSGRLAWSHPRQRLMLLLAIGVLIGSFLPWIETGIGVYRGFAGPGLVLFYAGVLGVGAGLVPIRSLAVAQAAAMSAAAIMLPLWQIGKLVLRVGTTGWAPGIGLVLVFGCGLMAARATAALARPPAG